MTNLIQFIQEKLSLNKNLRAKNTISIDDPLKYLQEYGISIMSEDDINKFNHFHTVKYNINKSYLSKLRKWHKSIYDDPFKNQKKLHSLVKYFKDNIDENLNTVSIGTTFASMYTIKINFTSSKYDIIQIKLPTSPLERFMVEIYNENKIEERKNFALQIIKYILENLK